MANGEYSEMIELPVSTCEMVVVPQKKKRFSADRLIKRLNKNADGNKKSDKLSSSEATAAALSSAATDSDVAAVAADGMDETVTFSRVKSATESSKKGFKFDIIGAEVVAIFVLVVAIILTNIFWEDSGINVMIKSVFSSSQAVEKDERPASELAVNAPARSGVTLDNGVMTVPEGYAVYAPADGKVESVNFADGVYTVTLRHSDVFKSIISGAESVYASVGDTVYGNIPVAYAAKGTTVAMYNGDALVTDYILDNGSIIWQN